MVMSAGEHEYIVQGRRTDTSSSTVYAARIIVEWTE